MRRILIIIAILFIFPVSVSATEYTAPSAPSDAQQYIPPETDDFVEGLWFVIKKATDIIQPEISGVAKQCGTLIICAVILSVFQLIGDNRLRIVEIIGVITAGLILTDSSQTLIQLGSDTASDLTDYGMLLVPVMTSALAAQGGITSSAALYTATTIFSTIMMKAIVKIIIPLIYVYLALGIASNALDEKMIDRMKATIKWLITWILKAILYIFTGYITLTGVLSGSVDASALKAAKLTISGTVPVIGGILADASETVLVSAGLMKNSAGIYGIFAVIAICIHPFMQTAIQYCLLKFTAFCTGIIGTNKFSGVISDFSTAMGFVLAITGAVSMMLLISVACFMKGIT